MNPDISVVIFATDVHVKAVESLLAEIDYQLGGYTYELFVVDGETALLNFDALRKYASSKGIPLEVIRQDSGESPAVGYNLAATQASGKALAFVDPVMTVPLYFFRVVMQVVDADGAWMPMPYADVEMPDGSCMLGVMSPAHNTLVMPTARYDKDRTPFYMTSWPRTDTYILLTRLAAVIGDRARLFPLAGLDMREPEVLSYRVSALMHDVHAISQNDGTWLSTKSKAITDLGCAVAPIRGREYTSQVVRECVEACVAELGQEANLDRLTAGLEDRLRQLVHNGTLPYVPEFELTQDGGILNVRSADGVLIPAEGWLQETDRWQDLMA